MSPSLKKNVFANYLGQGWRALMGIAFVPIYIRYLGIEAYGLIGLFTVMQAWLVLLDMGMTPTISREMARYTAGAHTARSIRDLLRSLEVITFAFALIIGVSLWFSSSWLAEHWLQTEKISVSQVSQAIAIIGFVVALRFIETIYRGSLIGLQKQVWLAAVGSGFATLGGGGAVFILVWVKPSIEAFFIWQGLVSAGTILTLLFAVHRLLPRSDEAARFSWEQLMSVRRFAGGMTAATALVLMLMQLDKVILSGILTLKMFGYYTLAGTVAAVLYQLTGPVTQAYYPRFTELVAKEDTDGLIKAFHQGAQLISVMILPPALMLIFFGRNILLLWTGDAALAHKVAPLLTLLALGTMLHCLMHIPYILTLAYGWPGFAVRANLAAVIVLVPAIFWATPRYGAIGAAWIWVILNLGYLLISTHFLYGRLLKTEKWRWYLNDVILPGMAALAVAALFSIIADPGSLSIPLKSGPSDLSMKISEWSRLLMAGLAMLATAGFATSLLRKRLFERLS